MQLCPRPQSIHKSRTAVTHLSTAVICQSKPSAESRPLYCSNPAKSEHLGDAHCYAMLCTSSYTTFYQILASSIFHSPKYPRTSLPRRHQCDTWDLAFRVRPSAKPRSQMRNMFFITKANLNSQRLHLIPLPDSSASKGSESCKKT